MKIIEKSISSKVYNPIWQSVLSSVELAIQSKIDNLIIGSIANSVSIPVRVARVGFWNLRWSNSRDTIVKLDENT